MENRLHHASVTPRDFTFELLKQITNNFSEDNRIGVGGYGVVYKGTLDNGEMIAVKKLYYKHPELDSDKQFQNECINLMRAHHQNIVRFVGYCHEIRHKCVEHNGNMFLLWWKIELSASNTWRVEALTNISRVQENWEKALQTTVLSHTSHGVKKCIEVALRCVEIDRVKRPTIAEVVDELSKIDTTIIDELNKIDTARSSPTEQVTNLRSKQDFDPCMNSGLISKGGGKDGRMINSCSNRATRASSDSVLLSANFRFQILPSANVKIFSYGNLRLATRKFNADGLLREGAFGSVYKGWINENTLSPCKPGTGIPVAVKRFDPEGFQGHQESLTEINYLGHLSHPNLVKLLGYCLEDEYRLLVYEFVPRGSLENHLYRRGSCQPLLWNLRMKVAPGAAKALAYLHSAEAKIIFRDIKVPSILLDTDYTAKLTDFGLAVNGPVGEESHLTTMVMGTSGYAAPEYLSTGHLTQKHDIYCFGVLLLEMLSGRRALDVSRAEGKGNLMEWARPYLKHKHKIRCVMDANLGGIYSFAAAQKVAALALECLCSDPKKRPTMDSVVSVLEGVQEDDEPEAEKHQKSQGAGKEVTAASASRKSGKSRWNIFGGGRS